MLCIFIKNRSLQTGEHPAVSLEGAIIVHGPLVKEQGIILELQQQAGNLLSPRHAFVQAIEASFVISAFGICQIS